jgi:NAD dependent epimerase/dehydratase family enzyme
MNRMFRWAIERSDVAGVYNATGPEPVTNRVFMRALRGVIGRPWSPPVPAFAVRIGCLLMGTEASLALTGRRCVPARLTQQGFAFEHADLNAALHDVIAR